MGVGTILAGDIGGTHARLGLFDAGAGSRPARIQETFTCARFPGLADLLQHFVQRHSPSLAGACLAVAGPVENGRGAFTNLGWSFDAAALAEQLGLQRVDILNDLEAVGYGLTSLAPSHLLTLNPGAPSASGNLAVISAGTGLGQCACYFDGKVHHPCASQGGHTDFAPRTEMEMDLLRHLRGSFPHVSYERVISGPGLVEIYKFLQATGRGEESATMTATLLGDGTPGAVVAAAVGRQSGRCMLATQVFLSILAAEAGNLALKVMARGGVYVGGGMTRRLLPLLSTADFMDAFTSKGAMRDLLAAMPVHIILTDDAGLLGAARYASQPRP